MRFLFLALIGGLLLLQSCASDDNADPNIPGSDRDKYLGNWLCTETYAGQAPTTFTITIQKKGDVDSVLVYNFNNIGAPFYAIWLISGNSITIPNQSIESIQVSGTGFYDNNKLTLSYTSDGASVSAVCTH